jgi:hypothetical protein
MHEKRISQRIPVGEAMPALAVLLLVVGVSPCLARTSEVWGARAPDVRLTRGAQGKLLTPPSTSGQFGSFFLWTKN